MPQYFHIWNFPSLLFLQLMLSHICLSRVFIGCTQLNQLFIHFPEEDKKFFSLSNGAWNNFISLCLFSPAFCSLFFFFNILAELPFILYTFNLKRIFEIYGFVYLHWYFVDFTFFNLFSLYSAGTNDLLLWFSVCCIVLSRVSFSFLHFLK